MNSMSSGWAAGKLRLEVDHPQGRRLNHPIEAVNGWIAAPVGVPIRVIAPEGARLATYPRRDLDPSHATGFTLYLDLISHPAGPGPLRIVFSADGKETGFELAVTDAAADFARRAGPHQAAKPAILERILNRQLDRLDGCRSPSALPADWQVSPRLEAKQDAVSAHLYGPMIHEFLAAMPDGGVALDAGAGLRKRPAPHVINMEIYDYPSTDVLAIGQDLPFRDESFDAILSIAVLEHVDDPFRCAAELRRVLKPGGRLLLMLPFLQAEHGYPSHYFNATRSGAIKLFEGLEVERQYIQHANHPILTLNQILTVYHSGLDPAHREQFLNMKVKDVLRLADDYRQLKDPVLTHLPVEKQFEIAAGTTTLFTKPA